MRRLGERPTDKDLMDMIAEVDEVRQFFEVAGLSPCIERVNLKIFKFIRNTKNRKGLRETNIN